MLKPDPDIWESVRGGGGGAEPQTGWERRRSGSISEEEGVGVTAPGAVVPLKFFNLSR